MKKALATLLAAVMVLSLATAFAASSPVTGDLTTGLTVTQPTSVTVNPPASTTTTTRTTTNTTAAAPATETTPALVFSLDNSPEAQARVDALKQQVLDFIKDNALIDFFPAEIKEAIAAETDDTADLSMDEVIALYVGNYNPALGQTEVTVAFTTPYTPGQPIWAVVALYDAAGNITWKLVEPGIVEILDNGSVRIAFSPEIMAEMSAASAVVLAVLSVPAK